MHRLQLGRSHSIEGANNAYLFPETQAVVDPGPPTKESWNALTAGIEDAGLAIKDVKHVLVTHWHSDHSGLAPRLADYADATVTLHEVDAVVVRDYPAALEARLPEVVDTVERWGAPEGVVRGIRDRERNGKSMDSCPVSGIVDGKEVAGLTAIHTPGHTVGHLAFAGEEGLFVGDAVLPNYTPNVGGTDMRISNPLGRYLESLARLLGRRTAGHPGHGETVDLDDRIREIVAHHEERCWRIYDVLDGRERATPWTVATELFGDMRGIHAQMGVGEAASHLIYLDREGVVKQVGEDPTRFTLMDGGPTPQIEIKPFSACDW